MLKTLELVSVTTFKVVDAKLLLFTKIDSMTAKSKSEPMAVNKVVALVVVKLTLALVTLCIY